VEKLGVPGAVVVKNNHAAEFFLKTITLDDVPGRGAVTFVANSWVYPAGKYRYNRVFFSNDVSPFSIDHYVCLLFCFLVSCRHVASRHVVSWSAVGRKKDDMGWEWLRKSMQVGLVCNW
jgi:hypothetical protein